MADYQDIKLVEANRLHSVQYNGGNADATAEWTNKIGSGINLQPGDTYEVHSSYISERGAESETIEFKGEFIERKDFIETQITQSGFNGSDTDNANRTINQYNLEEASNETVSKDLYDNKSTIAISYYINCMGEYSVMLPRRHILKCGPGLVSDPNNDINFKEVYERGLIDCISQGLPSTRLTSFFIPDYRLDNSQVTYIESTISDLPNCYKLKMDNARYTLFVKEKTYFTSVLEEVETENWLVLEAVPPGGTTVKLGSTATELDRSKFLDIIIPYDDGTVLTNHRVTESSYDTGTSITTLTVTPAWTIGLAENDELPYINFYTSNASVEIGRIPNEQGPCGFEYIPFKQLIDIELPAGKNSQTDISNIITDTLSTVQRTQTFQFKTGAPDALADQGNVTSYIETNTMKAFNCGNMGGYSLSNYENYMETQYYKDIFDSVVKYISNFQFVAYKRPEIQETGRVLNKFMWHTAADIGINTEYALNLGTNCVRENITVKGKQYGIIRLDGLVWQESNLRKFSEFVKSQALYPNLFDLNNIMTDDKPQTNTASFSVDTARFIHVNNHNNASFYWLGYDGIKPNADPSTNNGNSNTDVPEKACPWFFQYDKEYEDFFDANASINEFDRNPTFGCLYKVLNGNGDGSATRDFSAAILYDYYSFTNNINDGATNIWGEGLENARQGGFDQSFQAWSTCAILPFNAFPNAFPANDTNVSKNTGRDDTGIPLPAFSSQEEFTSTSTYNDTNGSNMANVDPNDTNLFFLSSYIVNKIYIGANKPSFIYDSLQNRFKFTLLNTPNRNQQQFNTGILLDALTAPEDSGAQAFTDVIKYNPVDLLQNFTPDRMPYQIGIRQYASQNASDPNIYTKLNPAIEPFRGYDSFCGISIDDFGYTQSNDNNNLWNILGFDDSQLFNEKTADNVISNLVVDANNSNSLSQIVTNADFQSVSTPQQFVNFAGVILGGQQLPTKYLVTKPAAGGITYEEGPISTPPISIEYNSIAFTAKNLPITILRPYYLIKSSLNEGNNYLGQLNSGIPSNIVGVVPKTNEAGDYYQKSGGYDIFTITRPMTISHITTSIHDPDGTLAHVNDGSSVIYKFTKQRNILTIDDIIEEAEQNQKSNKKKK